jgi:hypothetical protein
VQVRTTIDGDVKLGTRESEPAMTEIIQGPVVAADRIYVLDEIRGICRAAPRAVRRARLGLSVAPQPTYDGLATADCSLLVEGALIICAGAAANTLREAVDVLSARLRRRVRALKSECPAPRAQMLAANPQGAECREEAGSIGVDKPILDVPAEDVT